jgi:hypothetical protein
MTARLAIAFVLLLCVGGFGLTATINNFAIVDAVNAKLPTADRFDPFWWYLPKALRLHSAYCRLYPEGRLLKRQAVLAALMLLCLVLAVTVLGFGFLGIAYLGGLGLLSLWFVYIRKPKP